MSHNDSVKQLGPYIPMPENFQWRDFIFTKVMTKFCSRFSKFEYSTLKSTHFIFNSLSGWDYRKCNCTMGIFCHSTAGVVMHEEFLLSQKRTECIWKQNWPPGFSLTNGKIQDSCHYGPFSLLKKRPFLIITIKLLHIFRFATSRPH